MRNFNYIDRSFIQVSNVIVTHGYWYIGALQYRWIYDSYERIAEEIRNTLYQHAMTVSYYRPERITMTSCSTFNYEEMYRYALLIMLPTIKTIPFDSSVRSKLHDYLKMYQMPTLYLGHDGEKIYVENTLQPYIEKGFTSNPYKRRCSIDIPLTSEEIDLFDKKSAYLELEPTRRNAVPIPPLTPQ